MPLRLSQHQGVAVQRIGWLYPKYWRAKQTALPLLFFSLKRAILLVATLMVGLPTAKLLGVITCHVLEFAPAGLVQPFPFSGVLVSWRSHTSLGAALLNRR